MNSEVIVSGNAVPPTKVVLELEVDEFAALYALYHFDFDGTSWPENSVRDRVSRGLAVALNDLPDGWRFKCRRVLGRRRLAGNLTDAIRNEFGSTFDKEPELA